MELKTLSDFLTMKPVKSKIFLAWKSLFVWKKKWIHIGVNWWNIGSKIIQIWNASDGFEEFDNNTNSQWSYSESFWKERQDSVGIYGSRAIPVLAGM